MGGHYRSIITVTTTLVSVCVGACGCRYVRVCACVSKHTFLYTYACRCLQESAQCQLSSCLEFTIASDKAQVRQQERQTHSFTQALQRRTPAGFRALCGAGLVTTVATVLAGDLTDLVSPCG